MVSSDQLEAAVPCEPMHVNTGHSDGGPDELDLSPAMQTVAAAVASEKAKQRQQSLMLDKWLSQNGSNLYPSRDEKERLATQMNMTYMQVNRWFANRRRKQTKRSKAVNSPKEQSRSPQPQEEQSVHSVLLQQGKALDSPVASVLSAAIAAALAAQQPHQQRQPVSGCAENEEKEQSPRSSDEHEAEGKDKMVAVQLAEQLSAAEQLSEQLRAQQAALMQHVHHREQHLYSQVVPQQPLSPHHQPLSPLLQSPEVAKLVAQAQAGILPPQYNPLLLQILLQQQQQQLAAAAAAAQSQHGQQLLALQQHMQQHMASMHAAPQPPTAHTQAQLCAPSAPSWMSPPVSASPVPAVSDESELSELSELSPRPSSPPFKDPEQLADQSLLRLLNASQLSEKEHIAVSVLAGFASMAR